MSYVGTNVSVSLGELSARKINILGAVKSPGTYIINPFSTLSSALAYSGGFENYASLREIVLIRGEERIIFDLYDLLIFGNRESDVNIEQGDTILVTATKNLVEISGSVNRPMQYQFKSDDTVLDLLDFAMGITRDANLDEINIKKVENGVLSQKKIQLGEKLNSENVVELSIPKKIFTKNLNIEVLGEGVSQRTFLNTDFKSLPLVIANLEFSDDIYPFIGILRQDAETKIFKEVHYFSLSDPSTYENIKLKSNVTIEFFSRDQILEGQAFVEDYFPNQFFINLNLGVKKLDLPLSGKISAKTLIDFFGLESSLNSEQATITFSDGSSANDLNSAYQSDQVTGLYIPEKVVQYIEVHAMGLFQSSGAFEVPIGTTLEDLYSITGGLTDNRNISVRMTRESIKEAERNTLEDAKAKLIDLALGATGNIALTGSSSNTADYAGILSIISLAEATEPAGRLSGNLNPGSIFSDILVLEDGDTISALPKPNLITIIGQVLNPLTVEYETNVSVKEYIDKAGSFTEMADKRGIYIIGSDGASVPYDTRLFQNELRLQPGDTIVVPRDFDRVSTLPLVNSAAQIISNIALQLLR